ncbi:MAG: ABC-F family ATP-binding cassette domain-containing protein [Bacteroidetes bacterium]|nr:ABC-F family ATP-binding cassette domain-containing protein [Bacteroidota bacterium]MBT6685320.1 ABC-F family ATP-binding cassette domain-containing protein [Bacteroidota bacterium]MBT7142878.1 ABC-F family ATP-binding cassette domain-containing protein [Bacteroidota bacterium]MBT7490359.1 ABC-F family ATP-binding cassette domain-containing protein [Bacteroidota bacterium]
MNTVISYLQIENISKSYGDLLLFENVSLGINKDDKIALIAKNGAGKTSLLNVIAGIESADSGNISIRNNVNIEYLDQDPLLDENCTIIEQVYNSSNEIAATVKEYEEAIVSTNKKLIQSAMEKMDALNAWQYEVKVKQILSRLKIDNFYQPIKELSGGQRKRLALAKVLINEPDFLILDEPTNHLDLDMIEWLESYLKKSKSTLLMVTHDRYFLDRVCTEIVELDEKQIFLYKGNYSYFLEKREQRVKNTNANIEKARNLLRTELDWMRRSPQARTTKSKSRIEAFYDLQDVASQKTNDKQIKIDIKTSRLGKKIIDIYYLNKNFGDIEILKDFSYKFVKGEKIGIIGKNGSGKTTFVNLITGNEKASSGKIDIGETVKFGYFKQDGIKFKESQRVIDIVREIAELVSFGVGKKMSVTQFLNYFLFPSEMHYNRVSKLSGGEKRRLYLLTVLMKNPNFLILDEPTNDLDILTLNVLEEYLQNFPGCVLIVSHDRYFMDKIIDRMFVFEGNGALKDFPGDYSNYLDYKIAKEKREKKSIPKTTKEKVKKQNPNKLSYNEQRELGTLEKEIQELETEKSELEIALNAGNLNANQLNENSKRLNKIIELIDKKDNRWLELSMIEES